MGESECVLEELTNQWFLKVFADDSSFLKHHGQSH